MSLSTRSLAITTLLAAISIGQVAHAVIVHDGDGNAYNVTTITDRYNNISALLMNQPWWGESTLTQQLTLDLGVQLGTPNFNDTAGPGFARLVDNSFVYAPYFFPSGPSIPQAELGKQQLFTFAIIDTSPVPLPPALLLFAVPLVGLGLKRRRKI